MTPTGRARPTPADAAAEWPPDAIYTVGHSTRTIDDFIGLLRHYGIEQLHDIRTVPRSRRNPQFNRDTLATSLGDADIGYRHVAELGGLRKPRKDSVNAGWRNDSFRGYADHMQTAEFVAAVEALIDTGRQRRTAIMCAEAVPWRCHRSLVADALTVRDVTAVEIISLSSVRRHRLTAFAQVDGVSVTYPVEGDLFA